MQVLLFYSSFCLDTERLFHMLFTILRCCPGLQINPTMWRSNKVPPEGKKERGEDFKQQKRRNCTLCLMHV